jgi:hypothetical protein
VIGGAFTSVGGTPRAKVARLNADGTLDTSFDHAGVGPGPGTAAEVTKTLAVEGGKTIISGNFVTFNLSGSILAAKSTARFLTDTEPRHRPA